MRELRHREHECEVEEQLHVGDAGLSRRAVVAQHAARGRMIGHIAGNLWLRIGFAVNLATKPAIRQIVPLGRGAGAAKDPVAMRKAAEAADDVAVPARAAQPAGQKAFVQRDG